MLAGVTHTLPPMGDGQDDGTFEVDIIVPVHTSERPIRRAVASVLDHSDRRVRTIVVAHNIDIDIIRTSLGDYAEHPRLELTHLVDEIPSPAGPLNHGIATATADYYGVLGSDDELEPGAVDSWLELAESMQADAVLARVRRSIAGIDPLPPTRRRRTRDLQAVRDRLTYRCVPQGLVSRVRFGHLRFTPGLRSGEDQEFTAQLWFTAQRIAYDRTGPGYVLNEDGEDRITADVRTAEEDFRFLDVVASTSWYRALGRSEKRAWGVKNLRLHLMDAVAARLDSLPEHARALNAVVARIETLSPGASRLLSRHDRVIIAELARTQPDLDRIRAALGRRWHLSLGALLPRNPMLALHSQAPLRTMRAMTA